LTKLQKGDLVTTIYSEYDEQFQAFGILVLLLLILEIVVMESKNPLLKNVKLFKKSSQVSPVWLLFLFMTCSLSSLAQSDRQSIRQGNRLFRQQNYAKSEVEYRKAVEKNPNNAQAIYNLGCALMGQQKDSAAVIQFQQAGKMETSKIRKAMSYHNIGTICQRHQMFAEAIEAYKEALRNNPGDNETRYNLALCKRQQKNQTQQNQQNQQKKDQDKQGKDQQQEKQNPDKDKQQQKQQQPKDQMSKENAEQLLNAAIQEEKATQQRMKKALQQPSSRQLQKNW
jgi:Ca-activated chloride channel family protein